MSIVATEIESVHGNVGQQRIIYFRCQDDQGAWHSYGPVITTDDNFDAEAHMAVIADKVAEGLAVAEANQLIGA